MSIPARSCPEAQDGTTYPPIRATIYIAAPLQVARLRLSFGGTTLFDKPHEYSVKVGYQLTIDWLQGTDALPEV